MKIIFVTHGETQENADGILMGQLIGGELSPLGKLQAQELAKKLENTKIGHAYSSDLNRAVQTANEILKYHKDTQLVLTKDLRERNFGSFQGKKKNEVGWQDKMTVEDHEGFEPLKDLRSRIERFLLKIDKSHKDQTVLLVAHRNCGMALEAIIKGIPVSEVGMTGWLKNGSMKMFEYIN